MTINAAPGSARHAPRNSHSAVAGSGTLRQCSRCRRREPRVQFYAGKGKCSYCRTCWPVYLRERYAARRLERGYSYTPRKRTTRQSAAALDLTDCLKGWR